MELRPCSRISIHENEAASSVDIHRRHSSKPAPFDETTPTGCATQKLPNALRLRHRPSARNRCYSTNVSRCEKLGKQTAQ